VQTDATERLTSNATARSSSGPRCVYYFEKGVFLRPPSLCAVRGDVSVVQVGERPLKAYKIENMSDTFVVLSCYPTYCSSIVRAWMHFTYRVLSLISVQTTCEKNIKTVFTWNRDCWTG